MVNADPFHDVHRVSLTYGTIHYVSDVEEICSRVRELSQHKSNVRSKAKPFIATVDTSFDGHSGELGAGLVDEIKFR